MDIVTQLCKFTQQLLSYDKDLILRARDNFERINFSSNYIVIDELASVAASSTEKFTGEISEYEKVINMTSQITLDFFGQDGLSNAQRWSTIKNMQAGSEIQQALGVNILNVSTIRNLKALTGSKYTDRYQVECRVWYNVSGKNTINPIEDLQFNIINEE